MIISSLLIALSFSFCFQISVIILYVSSKKDIYYKAFLGTFVINTILMIVVSVLALSSPEMVRKVNLKLLLWILSGFILLVILFIKITVVIKILRRAKDPSFYTINFFGKKVYEKGIVKQSEFLTLILTMPFFLLIGSYFIARLINLIMYGHI